mmetsp:Transcript_21847/g.26004  ORF Transcript_21847/g.26004 Transcript_21847/m.26004 type:complete len:124 (-) Transcript_21847:103-474(-)
MAYHDQDSNAIITECLKTRSEAELIRPITVIYNYLIARGLHPVLHLLGNEFPTALKAYMTSKNVKFQLVPPYYHRTNPSEKSTSTWKDHFIAGTSSCDPLLPLHLWDRLVQQCTISICSVHPA